MVKQVKGFVIAGDFVRGLTVWKVRVKDPESKYNSRRLVVASIHDGIALAKGLNVVFEVGCLTGPNGQEILRAVDLQLAEPQVK